MNKARKWIAVLLLAAAPLAAQRISVESPNGGETLTKGGAPFPIAWSAQDVDQNVKIVLLTESDDRFGLIAEGLAPGSSPYLWTVGETRSGEAPAGRYKVRVVSEDGAVKDVSDGAFTIADGGSSEPEPEPRSEAELRMVSPNGRERLPLGVVGKLEFKYRYCPSDTVLVELYRGGREERNRLGMIGTCRVRARSADLLSASIDWRFGRTDGGTAPAGDDCYSVRISDAHRKFSDFSDGPFTLFMPAILVDCPARGDRLAIGTAKQFIKWISPNADSGVSIDPTVSLTLVRQADGRETPIASGVANAHGRNSYIWSIRHGTFNEPGEYRVRVGERSGMHGESGAFRLDWPEDDFLAEIVPGSREMRYIIRKSGQEEYDFRIKARFRNGSIFNDAVANVRVDLWVEIEEEGEWRIINSCGSQHITIPANGGWKTVEFKSSGSYGGFILPQNYRKPLKVVAWIDREREFADSERSNNQDVMYFTMH